MACKTKGNYVFGMIKEEKGLDILIKSFHEVHQNNKDVVLLIAKELQNRQEKVHKNN